MYFLAEPWGRSVPLKEKEEGREWAYRGRECNREIGEQRDPSPPPHPTPPPLSKSDILAVRSMFQATRRRIHTRISRCDEQRFSARFIPRSASASGIPRSCLCLSSHFRGATLKRSLRRDLPRLASISALNLESSASHLRTRTSNPAILRSSESDEIPKLRSFDASDQRSKSRENRVARFNKPERE
jgi:hypothetical protein